MMISYGIIIYHIYMIITYLNIFGFGIIGIRI